MMNRCVVVALAAIACGCKPAAPSAPAEPPVPVAASQEAPPPKDATGAREKRFEGLTLTIPADWTEQAPASEFIQAEYTLTGPGGPARLTMSSAGGGLEANLERWRGQFTRGPNDPPPQQETIPVGGADAVLIELVGTFRDGLGGGGEKPNWCMLGAIIPTGPANFFIKLTGPRETVVEHRNAIRQLVTSARRDR